MVFNSTSLCFQDLFSDVNITGVDAVSEEILCAALTAAEVTVMEELTVKHRETENQDIFSLTSYQAMGMQHFVL